MAPLGLMLWNKTAAGRHMRDSQQHKNREGCAQPSTALIFEAMDAVAGHSTQL